MDYSLKYKLKNAVLELATLAPTATVCISSRGISITGSRKDSRMAIIFDKSLFNSFECDIKTFFIIDTIDLYTALDAVHFTMANNPFKVSGGSQTILANNQIVLADNQIAFEAEVTSLQNLLSDIFWNITNRLNLTDRARLGCVSIKLRTVITKMRETEDESTSMGLCISGNRSAHKNTVIDEMALLRIHDKGRKCVPFLFLNTDIPIDSCNGFLLIISRKLTISYEVCHPVLGRHLLIPRSDALSLDKSYWASLLVNGLDDFKVLCSSGVYYEKPYTSLLFHIFSSKSREWRTKRVPLTNGKLLQIDVGIQCLCHSCYYNEKLYRISGPLMMIYDAIAESARIIRLPGGESPDKIYDNGFLFSSEGHIRFCNSATGHEDGSIGYNIWEFEDHKSCWKLKHFIHSDVLTSSEAVREAEEILREPSQPRSQRMITSYNLKPCVFNDDFQILYFLVRGIVLAYRLETKGVSIVWLSTPVQGWNHLFPYSFI